MYFIVDNLWLTNLQERDFICIGSRCEESVGGAAGLHRDGRGMQEAGDGRPRGESSERARVNPAVLCTIRYYYVLLCANEVLVHSVV